MLRRGQRILIALLAVLMLAGGGIFFYRRVAKDYVDCYRMLMRVYEAEASDLDFQLSLYSGGIALKTDFNVVRFPYRGDSAVKLTIRGALGNVEHYSLHGLSVPDSAPKPGDARELFPKRFMDLLTWGADLYQSGIEIEITKDADRVVYQVLVPDDAAQSFMDAYVGNVEHMDFHYTSCRLTAVASGGELSELSLQGTASCTLLLREMTSDVLVRARVNALNEQVEIPEVPDTVAETA